MDLIKKPLNTRPLNTQRGYWNQHGLKLRHNSILFMNTEHWGTVTFLVLLDAARFERDKPRLLATEVVASLVEVF